MELKKVFSDNSNCRKIIYRLFFVKKYYFRQISTITSLLSRRLFDLNQLLSKIKMTFSVLFKCQCADIKNKSLCESSGCGTAVEHTPSDQR